MFEYFFWLEDLSACILEHSRSSSFAEMAHELSEALTSEFGKEVSDKFTADDTMKTQLLVVCEIKGVEETVKALKMEVEESWAAYISQQPEYLQTIKDTIRESWFSAEGLNIITSFLGDGSALFQKPIDCESLPGSEQEAFAKAWKGFTRTFASDPLEGERLLKQEIEIAWLTEKQKLPAYLKPEVVEVCRGKWLQKAASDIVNAVTEMSRRVAPVDFADLPLENQEAARALWKKFVRASSDNEEVYAGFLVVVADAWESEKNNLPDYLEQHMIDECRKTWLAGAFLAMLTQYWHGIDGKSVQGQSAEFSATPSLPVVPVSKPKEPRAADESGDTKEGKPLTATRNTRRRITEDGYVAGEGSAAGELSSQKTPSVTIGTTSTEAKKPSTPLRTTRRVKNDDATEDECVTIEDIHTKKANLGKKLTLLAYIVQWPDEEAEDTTKVNVVLADDTGFIQATAWGEKMCSDLRSVMPSQDVGDDMIVGIKLVGFKVRECGMTCVPPFLCVTLPAKKCTVELKDRSCTPPPQFPMQGKMYVQDFTELSKVSLPFAANLRGIVHSITSTGTTQSGAETIGFKLQDERGNVVRLVSMGRYTESSALTVGHEVAIFFGKAQKAKVNGQEACIWIYNDSFVYVLAEARPVLNVRQEIALKEKKTGE